VTPKGIVQDWGEGTDVNTIGAAVTVLTVRAVTAGENGGAIVSHVKKGV